MASEVELKLSVTPAVLKKAMQLPWLRPLAAGPRRRERLSSTYFDTAKFTLREKGIALRIRELPGKRRVQTIKTTGNTIGGRDEWENDLRVPKPDLTLAKGARLRTALTRKLCRTLKPVFRTAVERVTVPVRANGSLLELAFDRGSIRAGTRREPVSEIEIELKSGTLSDLAALAARLAEALPVSYGSRAKSDRGYALRAGKPRCACYAGPIRIDAKATSGEAFAAIGLSCLDHLAGNEAAVRRGDPEGVHQMRVALRRLRAALSLFNGMLIGQETNTLKAELKWLSAELAAARDFDVIVSEGVRPLRRANPGRREIAVLEADLVKRRDAGFKRARAAVASERFRKLMLTLALWLIDGEWVHDTYALSVARRNRRAADFARELLRERTATIVRRLKHVDTLDVHRRHRLRIAAKKLRYAADFFGSLHRKPKKKARRAFEKALKTLQDALGTLNDIAVHREIARQFAHPKFKSGKRVDKAYAMRLLTGHGRVKARTCLKQAAAAGERLARAKAFWGA